MDDRSARPDGPLPRWAPSEAFYRALVFAVGLHARQARKNPSHDPYLSHLLTVASLVIEDRGSETEAIAALLHDAAEDRGGKKRLDQIEADFGKDVARIVEGCSDTFKTPKPRWRTRKERYIARLAKEPADVRRVSLSDKVHNARCTVADLRAGAALGEGFNADAKDQRWYYESLLACFKDTKTKSRHLPEFESLVAQITAASTGDRSKRRAGDPETVAASAEERSGIRKKRRV